MQYSGVSITLSIYSAIKCYSPAINGPSDTPSYYNRLPDINLR